MRAWPVFAALMLASPPARADLDVVFVLDTTGSMTNELREVKDRLHQIADALRSGRRDERLRFGVVAYRDRGDAYLVQTSPLTADLAPTLATLAGLRAEGGGDTPEDVVAGLAAALRDLEWGGEGVERQAFLVGDAEPHLDYPDGPRLEELLEEARRKRIVIHTIGCRSLSGSGIATFRRIAYATEGSYQHIGRVRLDEDGVAGAMLKALAPPAEENAPKLVPVVARLRAGGGFGSTDGLSVRHVPGLARPGLSCALDVALPAGVGLARPPVVRSGASFLEVELAVGDGQGGASTYDLDHCVPATHPIRVILGGR